VAVSYGSSINCPGFSGGGNNTVTIQRLGSRGNILPDEPL
jgi:hypothetical protein